ncbi:hypothetical protein [Methylobacterium brachiatum]|uniref:hypothetical protein n=1 Tax=Methylobacterium brachiatum TaxID=269660 RepID=UPI001113A518|nr:hypothetical protein [Methylobacterium brachiatum]
MSDVEAEINAMKMRLGVELDRDLAEELKIVPTSVAAWRRRGKVPDKYKLRYKIAKDVQEIRSQSSYPHGLHDAYVFALIAIVASKFQSGGDWDDSSVDGFELAWIGQKLSALHRSLASELRYDLSREKLRTRFDDIRAEIDEKGVSAWLDDRLSS